ncbi:MAG: FecR domain-containing protein [Rhodocyclaceae bacterium]|nr:FecR domain-containing protein [Rhodocyclaceae bacterium]
MKKHALVWALLAGLLPLEVAAAGVATVVGLRGEASISQGGQVRPLGRGDEVDAGAVIRTGAAGRVKLRFGDGSVVVVGDDSSLRVDHLKLDGEGRRQSAGFVLDVGLIGQTIAPGPAGSWSVRTPTAVTAVRGTEYVIEVDSSRGTAVHVRSGSVSVEPLAPPKGVRLPGGWKPSAPVLLTPGADGTTCGPARYTCQPADALPAERVRQLEDRLSGV